MDSTPRKRGPGRPRKHASSASKPKDEDDQRPRKSVPISQTNPSGEPTRPRRQAAVMRRASPETDTAISHKPKRTTRATNADRGTAAHPMYDPDQRQAPPTVPFRRSDFVIEIPTRRVYMESLAGHVLDSIKTANASSGGGIGTARPNAGLPLHSAAENANQPILVSASPLEKHVARQDRGFSDEVLGKVPIGLNRIPSEFEFSDID
ncbi:Uu.00g105530.m01.CDS01 [Anthostomella pinea]|uniref:Uu.00g105530.m01.CDS01 n=1 Tax=Anthostomella pinea TaxID=933095 RepID=A0AAI8VEN2_9PEZI|nr:Uu.00g105530.m01.CDS01 [Anthostomella pinea]